MGKKLILDIATIYPGKGGAGGGIWNYAKNLILELDTHAELNQTVQCVCLVNAQFDLPVQKIIIKRVPFEPKSFLFRFVYVHFYLPLFVLFHKGSLHKVYFEVPFWMPFATIVTIHDLMDRFYKVKKYNSNSTGQKIKSFYFSLVTNKAITNSKWICTPTEFVRQEIIKYYKIPPQKIIVTPLASSKVAGMPSLRKGDSSVDLYCIAAFHPHKGHLRLLEIFEAMCENSTRVVKLFLRGHVPDPAFFEEIQKRISRSKFNERIVVVEFDNKTSVQEIYSKADWVILLSEYEGFGLPVIEAQANGVPVVCSFIPTFREAAGDSVYYLDNVLDRNQAADLLLQLICDREKRKFLIEEGFKNVDRYSWPKLAGQMFDLYKTLN